MSFYREMCFLKRDANYINSNRDPSYPFICVEVTCSEDENELALAISYTSTNHCPNGWAHVHRIPIARTEATQVDLLRQLGEFDQEFLTALPLASRMVIKADAIMATLIRERERFK